MNQQDNKFYFTKKDNAFNGPATDIAVSGPSPDGSMHIAFIVDRIDVITQTKKPLNNGEDEIGYQLVFEADDSVPVREIIDQCSLTPNAFRGLLSATIERLIRTDEKEALIEILKNKGIKAEDFTTVEADNAE